MWLSKWKLGKDHLLSCLYCFDLLDAQVILHTCTVVSWVSWWAVTYVRIQCVVTCSTMKTRIYGKAEIGSCVRWIEKDFENGVFPSNKVRRMKLKYFGLLKRSKWRLGKDHLGGKDSWEKRTGRERPRRQWKRDIRDVFNMSLIEVGRLGIDRNRSRCAVKDVTPYGHNLQLE